MKTIAQQLNIIEFPFEIKDDNGNKIYREYSNGYWWKAEYDSNGNRTRFEDSRGFWINYKYDNNGNQIYCEDSYGTIIDNQPKNPCDGKEVIIEGKKYILKEVK